MTIKKILFFLLFLLTSNAFANNKNKLPSLFLFLGSENASAYKTILENPFVSGAQIIYSWKQLEPKKGKYDFSKIEKDLYFLHTIHKKLFIQLQDRSFEPTVFNVPDYIRENAEYHGGVAMQYDFPGEGKPITTGWVARVWDSAVRKRFALLIQALADKYDGKIYGINLPETAVDFDKNNLPENFSSEKYFAAEIKNIASVRNAFCKSIVIQYVNFFPDEWNNDHQYMSRLFSYAIKNQISLGGPDTVPFRTAHMNNSYPFFHKFKDKLLVGMAIQEPDYTYKNPETNQYFSFEDFYHFSQNYLGAEILFWNVQEPFLSEQLVLRLNQRYFAH